MALGPEQGSRQVRRDQQGDLDPGVARLLDRKQDRIKTAGEYVPLATTEVGGMLERFFAVHRPDAAVAGVKRVGGGASKEQFGFALTGTGGSERYILRMDPIQTAAETDRRREFEALNHYCEVVPAPRVDWLDYEGAHFGRPAAIMRWIDGVTKPTATAGGPNVTGIGTAFSPELRAQLAPRYLDHLARVHNHSWHPDALPSFDAPTEDPYQAARWQLNWWSRVWRDDAVQVMPIAALAERWMRANLPTCESPVLVHGDWRSGNFLFDEATGEITALLDWEFVHLGDFHEDLGWMLQGLYSTWYDGAEYVCGLYPRDEFVAEYERLSGRTVNPATLRWYEVLGAYKCLAVTLATSTKAARDGHNHQGAMLSWLSPVGYRFVSELCDMIEAETNR